MAKPARAAVVVAAGAMLLAACGTTSSNASSQSSTRSPIKIALVDSTTGAAGPRYARAAQGFLARIALQNASGGVDGHKLVPVVVNDAGNSAREASIVQSAVETKGAFGVVSVTPYMSNGYRWLQQNGIPVTGSSADGPEWAEPQDTNMFASDSGAITPQSNASTAIGTLFNRLQGAQGAIAALGYSGSPRSSRAVQDVVASAKYEGLQVPYLNTSITLGATDFTTEALRIKQSGANIVSPEMDNHSNIALMQALKSTGAMVSAVLQTGLDPTVVGSPSWAALQGAYFVQAFEPAQLHTKATKAFQAALKTYEHVPTTQFPDWSVYESWLGADLMIKGLELDGPNPTRAGVIAKLRGVTNYGGGGLLAHPIDYATLMEKPGPRCLYVVKAVKTGFTPVGTSPVCGTIIPGTGSGSSA